MPSKPIIVVREARTALVSTAEGMRPAPPAYARLAEELRGCFPGEVVLVEGLEGGIPAGWVVSDLSAELWERLGPSPPQDVTGRMVLLGVPRWELADVCERLRPAAAVELGALDRWHGGEGRGSLVGLSRVAPQLGAQVTPLPRSEGGAYALLSRGDSLPGLIVAYLAALDSG